MADQQENTQAAVLQQPNGQKIYLDLTHSTDWVVAGSIFVSALISFIGFVITIYVVKKSTESQIKSNLELIQSQEKQNKIEGQDHLQIATAEKMNLLKRELDSKILQIKLPPIHLTSR